MPYDLKKSYLALRVSKSTRIWKHRNARTNGRNIEPQLPKIDTRERRLHRMVFELEEHGIAIPGIKPSHSCERLATVGPECHHWIAQESDSRIALYLQDWQYNRPNDPAVQVGIVSSLQSSSSRHPYTVPQGLHSYFENMSVYGCGPKATIAPRTPSQSQTRLCSATSVYTGMR